MPRLLAMLIPMLVLLFLRRALTPVDGGPAGPVAAARLAIIRFLSEHFAGGHVSDEVVGSLLAIALLLAGLMGFVLHVVLQERAFGPWLNGLFCFFGAAGMVAASVAILPRDYIAEPSSLVIIASVGAICTLMLFALLKAALLERLDDFASGARPIGGSPGNKAVPANRIGAVMRRF